MQFVNSLNCRQRVQKCRHRWEVIGIVQMNGVTIWIKILESVDIFYYCDYVTIAHLILLYHDWSTEN